MIKPHPMIILARHGQTDFNSKAAGSAERLRGWKNVPLNSAGQDEASSLGTELQHYPISLVLSSDLSRAMDTANEIAKPHNLGVVPAASLRPWNLGNFQGQPVKDISKNVSSYVDNPTEQVPGGEKFNTFKDRFLSTLQLVMNYAKDNNRVISLVSHTRNAQLTKAWLAAGGQKDFAIDPAVMNNYSHEPHTGGYLLLTPDKLGAWQSTNPSNSEPRSVEEFNGKNQTQANNSQLSTAVWGANQGSNNGGNQLSKVG